MLRFDDFRTARLWRGYNRALQVVLALALVLGLNYLASQPRFFLRSDLTANHAHSLAGETEAQLRNLLRHRAGRPPIELFLTLPQSVEGDSDAIAAQRKIMETLNTHVKRMLDAFVYESGREGDDPIKVEIADMTRNAKLYAEVANKLKGTFTPGLTAIVVRCGDRIKAIDSRQLFRIRQGLKGEPEFEGFQGEEALLSALLEVTDQKASVVYYTTGHGEQSPDSTNPLRSSSRLVAELKVRRFDVRPLNLEQAREVPSDAELVIIDGPQTTFLPRETDKLRTYMREHNGRMLVMVDPYVHAGLEDLFADWGVMTPDALVVEKDQNYLSPDGDTIIFRIPADQQHAISKSLFASSLKLYAGNLRPVQDDPGTPLDDTLSITGLFYTSDHAWGERDYLRPKSSFVHNLDRDLPPPLCLGVAAERAIRMKGEAKIPAGRLVLVGSSDLAADTRFDKGGNREFIITTVNWLLDRTYLVNVPVRPLSEFKLQATPDELNGLARRYALLPIAVMLFGFLVHYWRKKV